MLPRLLFLFLSIWCIYSQECSVVILNNASFAQVNVPLLYGNFFQAQVSNPAKYVHVYFIFAFYFIYKQNLFKAKPFSSPLKYTLILGSRIYFGIVYTYSLSHSTLMFKIFPLSGKSFRYDFTLSLYKGGCYLSYPFF